MKKTTVFFGALALGVTAWAGVASTPDDTIVSFSTVGPDTYADGTVVADGEVYALVWEKGGAFDGFTSDWMAVGAGESVVAKASCAKNGRLSTTFFVVDPETMATLSDGEFAVYLLDTRVMAPAAEPGEAPTLQGVGLDTGVINAYAKVESTVAVGDPFAVAAGAVSATTASAASETAKQPNIESFEVSDGFAYITISNVPEVVRVSEGEDLGSLTAGAGEAPADVGNGRAIIIRKADGASGFFSLQGIK